MCIGGRPKCETTIHVVYTLQCGPKSRRGRGPTSSENGHSVSQGLKRIPRPAGRLPIPSETTRIGERDSLERDTLY